MSRIHEALKKAEIEIRQESAPPIGVSTLAEPKIINPDPQPNLRFEDLQARCAQRWQPDQHANVFNPGLSAKAAEQFRTLRSRLYQIRANQQLKVLLITSAVSGEGKTFLATNLGRAIARQPESRVLLIDADLRHSQMHASLGAPSTPGLADYLRGDVGEVGVIQCSPENNLCFIAGGNEVPNPSELLSNGRLATLLERVTPIFEWIILDSPPSLPVADASVLAEHCDGLIVVVRAYMTPAAVVQKGVQELRGRKVIGAVLNAVEEDALAYGHYHSGYRHDYVKELNP